jgi:hypothetical protein
MANNDKATRRQIRSLIVAAGCLTWTVSCCGVSETANATKPIHTWFHCYGDQSFSDLKKHADVITSISVFGEPSKAFVTKCRKLGVETYRLVSGPVDNIAPPKREGTIASYLKDCQELGFDGIDLDYEALPRSSRGSYSEFIRDLAAKLRAADKKLSICVAYTPAMQGDSPDTGFYDPDAIVASCDLVRVMCYDKHFAPKPGHGPTSTAPWAREAVRFWLRYVPKEKLVMGLPAYSNDYDLRLGRRGRQVYKDRPELPKDAMVERTWRPFERIHVYRYLDKEKHARVFYASDAMSTTAHLETVKKLDVVGFGFWHHGSISPEIWSAIRKSNSKP